MNSGKQTTDEHHRKPAEFESAAGIVLSCAGASPHDSAAEVEFIEQQTRQRILARCGAKEHSAGSLDEALYYSPGHRHFVRSARLTLTTVKYKRPYIAPGDQALHAMKSLDNHYTLIYEPVSGI